MGGTAPKLWDVRVHAAADPGRAAVVCGTQTWSYGVLEAMANRLAATLRAQGLVRGDHVASIIGNRPEMLALAWAAWRSGLYLTPIPTGASPAEVEYLVADSGARAVVAELELAARIGQTGLQLPGTSIGTTWLTFGGHVAGTLDLETLLPEASPLPAQAEPPGALMMYTSGTTGAPKGVIRPLLPQDWRGTPPFAVDLLDLFGVAGHDVRYLSTAPLYHAAPLRFALAVTAGGGTAYVMDKFDARAALSMLREHAITHSQWVPAMFQRLLALPQREREAHSAPRHRCAIHGAAPCPPELKQRMIDWWGPILLEYYSGTEGVGLTLIDSHEAGVRPGSVGRARKGRIRIIDDTGSEVLAGTTGQVCFSDGPSFAYHGAPEKTAQRRTAEGWQTFGDVGHVDSDGYLYLTDREDDLIISGGVNVYPQEIEKVIRAVPGVWECAVVGWPDERFGETPVAFIVAARDADHDVPGDVLHACRLQLGRAKQPSRVELMAELPRSATGKLLRRALRAPQR